MFRKGDVVKGGNDYSPAFLLIGDNSLVGACAITCLKEGEGIGFIKGDFCKSYFLLSNLWELSSFEELAAFEREKNDFVDMPDTKEEWEDVFPLFIEMTKPENLDRFLKELDDICRDYDREIYGLPLYNEEHMKVAKYAFQEWIKSLFIDYKYG